MIVLFVITTVVCYRRVMSKEIVIILRTFKRPRVIRYLADNLVPTRSLPGIMALYRVDIHIITTLAIFVDLPKDLLPVNDRQLVAHWLLRPLHETLFRNVIRH